MKTLTKSSLLVVCLMSGWLGANAQTPQESEVPGDNFSLEGALELFKKSASPEEFEKLLNSPDSKVNNLDLNNDNNIDYIRVTDRNEGNVHAFIIQAVISETESQDVAVIELEKQADGKAVLQITGDADIYGVETIIEPTEEVRVNAGTSTARTVVNVWAWPSVQYVYSPYYSPWYSPWGWAYRPQWWSPWSPLSFYVYGPMWRPYRPYYSLCYNHRIGYLPRLYNPYRTTSMVVYNNYHQQVDHYRSTTSGRDRYDGRPGGHTRYEGYGDRSRTDYNHGNYYNNGRRNDTNDNRFRSDDRGRNSNHQYGSSSMSHYGSTPQRSNGRSYSDFRSSSPNSFQHSSGFQQRMPEQRSFNHSSPQRTPNSFNSGNNYQQRSPGHSFGGSSGRSSMPASSGRSGGGGNGGSSHHRGR